MEFKILPFIAFLSVAIVVSHAALPSEEYWNSVLPNTPMPKAVKELLQPTSEWLEDKSTSVGVGGGGVNVNNNNNTHVSVGGKGGGVTVGTHNRRGRPVYVRVAPGQSPFIYHYAATESQLHDDPNVALFFLEKDLYAGNKMNLHFSKPANVETFLPRHVADSIPFSSSKLPEIYSEFSVKPDSDEAEAIKKTIQECEDTELVGEERFCATSLESMVDFSTFVLGKDARAVSTEAESAEQKVYRIEAVTRMPSDKPVVVCHKQEYAYAVFYCHKTDTTVAYGVSLVGAGGSKAEAVAVCHRDTSEWNPKHLAFQVLKVKPGSVPVCHYLPENHIVWASKN
ncbi:BURP domain protein RD22 [Salvia miltiorrhiza]|uniref:BURP domain protein RD22 n=1 Tax=Salvia miltiorrhiza TaxID=226208 RepID=UPI0025ABCB7C|nr:BURP domain protein RD22 [Salvia miltiorrhiza]